MVTGRRVWEEPWPEADPSLLVADTFELVVQVNGKLRDRVEAPADASREEQEALARQSERVLAQLNGGQVVKTIVVPGKLVNFVVR
jgi:leucyl-tRNA synthetase